MKQAIEIMRFTVEPKNAAAFLERRLTVDAVVSQLEGFVSAELCQGSGVNWVLIVRWISLEAVTAAQKITATLPIISEWVALTSKVVSFETVEVRRIG